MINLFFPTPPDPGEHGESAESFWTSLVFRSKDVSQIIYSFRNVPDMEEDLFILFEDFFAFFPFTHPCFFLFLLTHIGEKALFSLSPELLREPSLSVFFFIPNSSGKANRQALLCVAQYAHLNLRHLSEYAFQKPALPDLWKIIVPTGPLTISSPPCQRTPDGPLFRHLFLSVSTSFF